VLCVERYGSLMRAFCARMEEQTTVAYLEAEKLVNAGFQRRFGFETIDAAGVIGVPSCFTLRQPKNLTDFFRFFNAGLTILV
jgi:hypothetical protein